MPNKSKERTLSVDQARAFYDRLGARLDSQAFYEDPAIEVLLKNANFRDARSVFEFGCGTGRFAARLLAEFLPAAARYVGIDASPVMVGLAGERIRRWAGRAAVRLSDGSTKIAEPDASFDRFVSNYVLDLLAEDQIASVLAEAHRILAPNGLLCLISLTHGQRALPRLLSRAWRRIHAFRPQLVGGCRPIELLDFIDESQWRVENVERVCSFGLTSEVLVAAVRSGQS